MLLTLGQIAERFHVALWKVARLANMDRLPVVRAGRLRVVREEDLGAVEEQLRLAGYLDASKAEPVAG